jgi:leucyl aminopeptidase (aminopeptidase T)
MNFAHHNPCWWRYCTRPAFARLKKPARNPGKGIFALVANSKTTAKERKNNSRLKSEEKRRQLAQKRIENAIKREMTRRARAMQKINASRKSEAARVSAFKKARAGKVAKQRLQAQRRKQQQRRKVAQNQ